MTRKANLLLGTLLLSAIGSMPAWAGSIFLTGHDPDFHASVGGNAVGAQHINQDAINFVTDPAFNPFTAADHRFLFVESSISPPSGHIDGEAGILASGYVAGTDFDKVDASGLAAALGQLGTKYDAIVIGSDFGGILTQAELDILNADSAGIISFLNSGGGLYAMAESGSPFGLTTSDEFGFLPFVVASATDNQSETGFTVTPFGASLGLSDTDINGNASHNIFNGDFGLNVVDHDANGDILSVAGRGEVTQTGIPEPLSMTLFASGVIGLFGVRARRRRD